MPFKFFLEPFSKALLHEGCINREFSHIGDIQTLEKLTMQLIFLLFSLLLMSPALAKDSYSGHHNSNYCSRCIRDSNGHIKRSPEEKNEFKKSNPCPSTGKSSGACPGFVIDHITPLKRNGADTPCNMQWQTTEDAKEKGKTE